MQESILKLDAIFFPIIMLLLLCFSSNFSFAQNSYIVERGEIGENGRMTFTVIMPDGKKTQIFGLPTAPDDAIIRYVQRQEINARLEAERQAEQARRNALTPRQRAKEDKKEEADLNRFNKCFLDKMKGLPETYLMQRRVEEACDQVIENPSFMDRFRYR